ncbi:MAG: amidohydrolase family protein [Candidatus Sericytochromatia bacterium]
MSRFFVPVCALLLCLLTLTGCASYLERFSAEMQQRPASAAYALVGVNVIPVDRPGVLRDQTLLVQDGLIVGLGPRAQTAIPSGFESLPLQGRYVLPGFADMHVHLSHQRDLLLLLRHGVTQVRNMADSLWWAKWLGFPHTPALRNQIRAGHLLGPDIFACGPFLDGDPPQNSLTTSIYTREQAREAVRETARAGFDCVKVYNRLSRANFEAIVQTARELNLPVMGHVPFEVGIEGALNARMATIEHLNAYVDNFAGVYRVAPAQWADYARRTAAAGIYNCPTLVIWDQHPPYGNYASLTQDPRYAGLSGPLRFLWESSLPTLFEVPYADKAGYPQALLALSKPMVKALYDGGAPLLIGTDANLTGVFPGSTALREMELFAEAGLPPAAILQAATLNAARVLGREHEQGSVTVGKRAQLVVLADNPLQDIRAVHSTQGVLVQGRWWTVQQLDQMLAEAPPLEVLATP